MKIITYNHPIYRKTRDTVRIFCDGEDVELQPQQILYA